MIRSELVDAVTRDNPHLTADEVERTVATVLDAVIGRLAGGGRVELRGFGTFSTRQRDARTGRNPKTGVVVEVAAQRAVHFKPGKALRTRLLIDDDG